MRDDSPEMRDFNNESNNQDYPAAVSDIGCEREINEDRYACFSFGDSSVWLVCDGMGGAVGGELAAQLAIDTIKKVLENDPANISHKLVGHAFNEANRVVVLRRQNPAFSGMGTTIVGVVITPTYLGVFHAGDSRAYILSGGRLEQITTDHTYVQDLVSRGMISQSEAMQHPQSHVLTRCLGGDLKLDYDDKQFALCPLQQDQVPKDGDTVVLCSDGLYSLVSDQEIGDIIKSFSPQMACAKLVELARSRGGYDNITVAIVPLGLKVNLDGDIEISQLQNPKISRKEAKVLSREESMPRKGLSMKQKIIILSMLGLLSVFALILGLMLI